MTEPGSGASLSGQQPGTPNGWPAPEYVAPTGHAGTTEVGWAPPQQGAPSAPPAKKGRKKWLSIGGSIVAAGVIGTGALFAFPDPEVGDCVKLTGDTSFDVVDCGGSEAEYKIVGVEKEELTEVDLQARIADDSVCADFPNWEVALWNGDVETEPGTVYCTEAS